MHGRIAPLFLLFILVLAGLPFGIYRASGVGSFYWLSPGTEAFYTISEGGIIFDDRANGNPFRGNYSWLCVDVNDTDAVLDVNVTLELFQKPEWTTPGHIIYAGQEFVDMASRGDLSFIKRIPMDQVTGRLEIANSTDNPGVYIPSPIVINQKFRVTVDLDSMMMTGEDGKPWGKWVLWIDPFKYSLEGWQNPTVEPFIMNWLNTTVNFNISYFNGTPNLPINTTFGTIYRYFWASVNQTLENPLLTELGWSGIGLTYAYEPRTGVLLSLVDTDFIDDTLTQRFGIAVLFTFPGDRIRLSSNNISLEIPEFPSLIVLPLFLVATLLAVSSYRRVQQHTVDKRTDEG